MEMREQDLQKQCVEYLTLLSQTTEHENLVFYAPMNEGVMMVLTMFKIGKATSARIVKWLRKMGFIQGISDLVVGYNGATHYVELKTERGKQSEKQKEFQRRVEKCGFTYTIVRSLNELKTLLKSWGLHIII